MKIEITKFHIIFVAVILLFVTASIAFLYYQTTTSVDKRLDDLTLEMSKAKADKACKENSLSDEECNKVKEKTLSDSVTSRLEFIAGVNKECKDKSFSESQCEQHTETYIKKIEEDIKKSSPFSELDPQFRVKIEEMGNNVCEMKKLSKESEECKKTHFHLLQMAHQSREKLVNSVMIGCKQRGWAITDEKCKQVEAKVLEDYQKDFLSGGRK